MKLATVLPYATDPAHVVSRAVEFESAGIDVLWIPEAYGFDSVSMLGFLAARTDRVQLGSALLSVYSRSPALLAMTAAGVDALSGGRFLLGIGASGPQVVEGWHGVPFERPVGRIRDVIEICRAVWRRERVAHDGSALTVPLPSDRGTGQGKALKLIGSPVRAEIPIFVGALGPRSVEMTAEIADGWIPALFNPERADRVWSEALTAGQAQRESALEPLELVAGGSVAICDEDQARDVRDEMRPSIALYVGGMGSKSSNFYNDVFRGYGFEEAADQIQEHYLDGRRAEAAACVPERYLDEVSLVGDAGFVRERLEAYRAAGVTQLAVTPAGDDPTRVIETLRSWIE